MKLEEATLVLVGAVLVIVGAVTACRNAEPPPAPSVTAAPDTANAPALVVVPSGSPRPATSAPVAFAEVVSTRIAREHGLGGRTSLEPDHGMLFVYAAPTVRRFWMKDCAMGLDIAFVRDDRSIALIATLGPGAGLPAEEIPSTASEEPVRYVLEMEPGWFARHGVRTGGTIDVSAAVQGVEAE